jgi:hypothetical protein
MSCETRHVIELQFGMTIENSMTRLWFCWRSSVIVSEAFDFINLSPFFNKKLTLDLHEGIPNTLRWNTIRNLKI